MPSSFDWRGFAARGRERGARFWLQLGVGTLAMLNAIALFFYLAPPGGSRQDLSAESQQLRSSILSARLQANKLKRVSQRVQLGGEQSLDFESRYILPKRVAYDAVIAELQRLAQAAKVSEREGVFTEEPIEGTADLTILNATANFEGDYASLLRFLYEADRSPMLLMLYKLDASPQKAGQIAAQVRFQAVIRDESGATAAGGQQ